MVEAIQGQTALPALAPPLSSYSFPARETLNYTVDWRVFPAGTASIHLEQQGSTMRITGSGETIQSLNLLFRVSDKYQSTFDLKTGCSYGFSKQIIEGRRQVNTDLKFDYGQHKSTQTEKNLVSGISKHEEAAIPGCVTDLLSAIFYAASQPIQMGQSFQMPLADALHTLSVAIKPLSHEEVKTPSGTYQTIRVQPVATSGVVKNKGEIWIWYTDDARHIPVQMRARLFWGTLTMRLSSIDQK
ncbi:DUF3108 domain-containing protein [Acidisarcina polymorpha]|nr:DUF3108 domain-containing protein [Acidisarcina polymorpha]